MLQEILKASHIRIARYNKTGNIVRRLGSGRLLKVTAKTEEVAFREVFKPVIVRLSFLISQYGNVQNFSSHVHLNTEHNIVP